MAVVAAFLFFGSLLLHELGHAIQARREGMVIDGITLWLFGGVASFRSMFKSAGSEFRIAIAGPAVSLVLGLLFIGFAAATDVSGEVDGVAAWLGYINLTLLVFNLLPALPLDGGRVLRSALWAARKDFRWATTVAANVGRAFGFLMIGGGILLFALQGSFSGVWLAFLGWFLLGAASGEARYAVTSDALRGLSVGDLMVRAPVVARADATVGQFMAEIAGARRSRPTRLSTQTAASSGCCRSSAGANAAVGVGPATGRRARAAAARRAGAERGRARAGGVRGAERRRRPAWACAGRRASAWARLRQRHRRRARRAGAPAAFRPTPALAFRLGCNDGESRSGAASTVDPLSGSRWGSPRSALRCASGSTTG